MIPKFSIRQLLWAMVAIGLLSLCMSSAARGNRIAFGISVAVIGSIIPFSIYAVVHWASFAVANFMRLIGSRPSPDVQPAPVGVTPEVIETELEQGLADDSADDGAKDV